MASTTCCVLARPQTSCAFKASISRHQLDGAEQLGPRRDGIALSIKRRAALTPPPLVAASKRASNSVSMFWTTFRLQRSLACLVKVMVSDFVLLQDLSVLALPDPRHEQLPDHRQDNRTKKQPGEPKRDGAADHP